MSPGRFLVVSLIASAGLGLALVIAAQWSANQQRARAEASFALLDAYFARGSKEEFDESQHLRQLLESGQVEFVEELARLHQTFAFDRQRGVVIFLHPRRRDEVDKLCVGTVRLSNGAVWVGHSGLPKRLESFAVEIEDGVVFISCRVSGADAKRLNLEKHWGFEPGETRVARIDLDEIGISSVRIDVAALESKPR